MAADANRIPTSTSAAEVRTILDHLDAARVIYQVNGGWGVDALAGRETRVHRDLDVFVDAGAVASLLDWLSGRGYGILLDWRPVRVELGAPHGRVDVHPMDIQDNSDGIQQGLDGQVFLHAVADRTVGRIGGQEVVVATADRQRQLRAGYAPRPEDRHDLAVLDALEAEEPITSSPARSEPWRVRRPRD